MKRVWLLPFVVLLCVVALWEYAVARFEVPVFVLPAPSAIWGALERDFASLILAAIETLKITLLALVLALVSGTLLALGFSLSRSFEAAIYPFAVVLQVTPIVSVAPLILIWTGIDGVDRALVLIAWLAAFFPVLATMSAGMKSVDRRLSDLFTLYQASPWQRFRLLLVPTMVPFVMAGLRVSAGLALVGAVVAEFVAGSGGAKGLAWRILEAGNRLQVDKMFAGLILLALIGVLLFYSLAGLERFVMRHRRI